MKSPAGHNANTGVSSYEHLMDTARAAHHGSKNSEPHAMSGGSAPGMSEGPMHGGIHNFSGGTHNLGM
jgi:hypothetical protein